MINERRNVIKPAPRVKHAQSEQDPEAPEHGPEGVEHEQYDPEHGPEDSEHEP